MFLYNCFYNIFMTFLIVAVIFYIVCISVFVICCLKAEYIEEKKDQG